MNNNEFSLNKDEKYHQISVKSDLVAADAINTKSPLPGVFFSLPQSNFFSFRLTSAGVPISLISKYHEKNHDIRQELLHHSTHQYGYQKLFCSNFACKYKPTSKGPINDPGF